ncbi:YbaN family protein [Alloalcanivorax marinus]|uniref:YbaN family protein n=2 Tax=Alloalcanivorax TaxID=3020832 RepID=UPI0030839E32
MFYTAGMLRTLLWRSLALLCVALGLIGVVVPGMPTTVFMLIAAWAGTRGWPRLETWLVSHPRFGPPIVLWREQRAMSRRAKCAASTVMLISVAIIAVSPAPNVVKIGVPLFLCGLLLWMWRRPEPTPEDERRVTNKHLRPVRRD